MVDEQSAAAAALPAHADRCGRKRRCGRKMQTQKPGSTAAGAVGIDWDALVAATMEEPRRAVRSRRHPRVGGAQALESRAVRIRAHAAEEGRLPGDSSLTVWLLRKTTRGATAVLRPKPTFWWRWPRRPSFSTPPTTSLTPTSRSTASRDVADPVAGLPALAEAAFLRGDRAGRRTARRSPSALGVIEAKAQHDTPVREVFVRVGELDGKVYLDLCDRRVARGRDRQDRLARRSIGRHPVPPHP